MSKNKKNVDSISDFSVKEIKSKIVIYKKELFNLRFQKSLGDLKNTSRFSSVRKNIARLNTELRTRVSVR
ncbi:MAG TPA: 50S ribosomal protein L29 [Candidatus Megaira endosymbiont of Nemacystus decipiens]|nr:50S ribosomal protein L29 [Candidatus Megaera endosymbiont of Nemacystus decipiens]